MKDFLQFFIQALTVYLATLIIMYLSVIGHELGHILLGKLTGYRFVSFAIGRFLLVKNKGKFHLIKKRKSGLAGQALMAPPDFSSHLPYILYNLGGVIINFLFLVVGIIGVVINVESLFALLIFIVIILCNLFCLCNGLPIILSGVPTDGKNIQYASQNEAARYAFFTMLKVNEQIHKGIEMEHMPDEWFTLKAEADRTNPLVIYQDWLILGKMVNQVVKGQQAAPILDIINERLAFLENAPMYYRILFLNEAIFWFILCDYQTDWALSIYESEDFKKIENVHRLPGFYKTHAIIALKNSDLQTAQTSIEKGLEEYKKYPWESNERSLLKNLASNYLSWKTQVRLPDK